MSTALSANAKPFHQGASEHRTKAQGADQKSHEAAEERAKRREVRAAKRARTGVGIGSQLENESVQAHVKRVRFQSPGFEGGKRSGMAIMGGLQ